MQTSVEQQMARMLRADFLNLTLGILITAAALAVLAVYLLRAKNRSPLLLWLGWFALLYGVRVLVKTPTTELLIDLPRSQWDFAEKIISNFILVPALLFNEQLYGKGWRSSMRLLLWFAAVYGVVATVLEVVLHNPQAAFDEGSVVLIPVAILNVIGYFAGYRPPPLRYARILLTGVAIFIVTIVNEHLVNNDLLPWHVRVETIGFFVLICVMGYTAARQAIDREQNLMDLEEEMRSATRIQSSILPREAPQIRGATICVRYSPMTAVAGDFYEFLRIDPSRLGIALADVAGHGVPAALVASMVKVAINAQSGSAADPSALLRGLNDIMCRQAQGKLITAGYLYLDLDKKRACYAAAANPPVLIRRHGDATVLDLAENGLILGVRPDEEYSTTCFDLLPGDRIVLYTDGIGEATDGADRMYGEERLREMLKSSDAANTRAFAERLLAEVRAWGRMDEFGQADDMTLLVIDVDLPGALAV